MRNCTQVLRAILCIFIIVTGVALPSYSQMIKTGINCSNGDYLGFLEYKPVNYATEGNVKHPLIIFLHGIGERGNGTTELSKVDRVGLPRVIKQGHPMTFTWNGKTETFLVLMPQCPSKYGMWPQLFVTELIKYAKENLRIDTNRIYLTGLSMGGGGSLRYISTSPSAPKTVAATATICAPCVFDNGQYVADAKLPLWAFHAADDDVALSSCTDRAINRTLAANPEVKPLRTIWPTGGHLVWDRVYTDTNYRFDGTLNIYEWFLGQNKSLPVNKLPVARATGTTSITTGNAVANLSAETSTDSDGKIVRYVWKKLSGPNAGVIVNRFGSKSTTAITGLTIAGTYVYELSVVDDRAGFTRDTISITVSSGAALPNVAPVAKAGNGVTIVLPTSKTTLSGSQSTDSDGEISTYLWTKVSGPAGFKIVSPNSATTEVNSLTEGTYVFKLKVTDNKGASAEAQVTVKVNPAPAPPNVAPVAKAGNDATITLPTSKTTLNGSQSTDSDGEISTYLWTKVSGPAGFKIVSPNSATTEVNSLTEGTYVFKLKVTDNKGASAEAQVTVKVNPAPAPPNVAPVAKAGNDATITLPTSKTTLNGSQSADSDGEISTYLWTKVSGPAGFKIVSPNSATTEVNSLTEGTYVFKLKVTDNKGASAEAQVTVKVNPAPAPPNVAPVAKAGNDATITLPTSKTTLNGSQSTDSDGEISTYLWTKVSGPAGFKIVSPNSVTTEVNSLTEGTYVFKLKVTDNKGASAEAQVSIKVNPAPAPPNVAPVAKAGNDVTIILPTSKTTLNGSQSSDSDGEISTYLWTKVSGPAGFKIVSPNSATTEVNSLTEGTYVFKLKVTDNKGASAEAQVTVKVNPAPAPPNVAPVAKAGNDATITLPTSKTTLNGSQSSDSDGEISTYLWTKVSGPAGFKIVSPNSATTEVNSLTEGTYVFKLKVTDNKGASAEAQVTVKVNPAPALPNVAPVAIINNKEISLQLPVNETTLNGSASKDNDGNIVSYLWTKISGPSSFNIVNTNSSVTIVENLVQGTYYFMLTVKDNEGAEGRDTIKIFVNKADNIVPQADAGADIKVQMPDPAIRLNGLNSIDPDGEIVSYSWSQVSGNSGITITNSTTTTPGIYGVTAGEYIFRLTVIDNDSASSTDDVTVTVLPANDTVPPVDTIPPVTEDTIPDSNLRYEQNMNVYPNPAVSNINVKYTSDEQGKARVSIYNMSGMLVHVNTAEKNRAEYQQYINISHLQKGIYYIEITVEGKRKTTKFVKQ